MEHLSGHFLSGGIAMVVVFTLTWLVQLRTRNAGIVDSVWALSFPILSIIYFVGAEGYLPREIMLMTMVMIWGLRLATYLFFRTIGHDEDARYTTLRREWGQYHNLKMLRFFYFQAVLALVLSLPFVLIMINPDPELHWMEYAGAVVWLVGVIGESIADQQLKTFKADPNNKGKVCDGGLWHYSRHPNYFFEWTIWVAYFILALGSPGGYWSAICPALMLYFLLRVTGIPYTENQIMKSRGPAYRAYQETTSAFIPLPRKNPVRP